MRMRPMTRGIIVGGISLFVLGVVTVVAQTSPEYTDYSNPTPQLFQAESYPTEGFESFAESTYAQPSETQTDEVVPEYPTEYFEDSSNLDFLFQDGGELEGFYDPGLVLGESIDAMNESDLILEESAAATLANQGPHFFMQEAVTISGEFEGDVYAAGSTVIVNGVITGDLIVAGENVMIAGEVKGDVRAAASSVIISGTIGEDITVAAATLTMTDSSSIGGSIIAFASSMNLDGQVAGKSYLLGHDAQLGGRFNSSLYARLETLQAAPTASIGGDVTGIVRDSSLDSSIVTGTVSLGQPEARQDEMNRATASSASFMSKVIGLAGMLIISAAIWYVLKNNWKQFDSSLDSALGTIGMGALYVIATPFVLLLLLITIIGAPLAGILLLLYLVCLAVAIPLAIAVISTKYVPQKITAEWAKKPVTQIAVGVLAYGLVGIVPLIGGVMKLGLMLFGIGIAFGWLKQHLMPSKA